MKRYPEYKESGLEWIGEIPKHWQVLRNFAIFSDRSDRGHPHLLPFSVTQRAGVIPQEYSSDQIVRVSSRTENGKRICEGDLVYNKMRMWQGAVGVAPAEGRVSTAYVVCQPRRDLIPEFFEYLYRTPLYMTQSLRFSYGGCKDQYCLYPKDFKNIHTIFPPKQEQTQIVNFLDRKTGQIDELIRIKERQVELLHEQRTVLINQVVTKGLDPNVEMKPSGIEWIGEIPTHWEVTQIKQIALFIGGYSEFGSESYTDKGIPIFRIGDITQSIKMKQVKRVPTQQVKRLKQNQLCHGDTLIVMIGRRAGESTYYAFDYPSILSAQVAGLRATRVDSKFLFYFIHSASFLNTVIPLFFGATRDNISKTVLMGVKIPFPPDREQTQIANFLNHKTGQIDELISTEQRKIELLKEYRQSLISEAVTGKIDVRNEV